MSKKKQHRICVGQVYKLWFNKHDSKDNYSIIILAQVDENAVAAICIGENRWKNKEYCFNRWDDPVIVDNLRDITPDEFRKMVNGRKTELIRKKNLTLVSLV